MSLPPEPVQADASLPSETEVVVIGGGIIGVFAALILAERGIPVVLCEKGIIAGEQSGRNWGWCRATGRDPRELPLILESLRLWRDLDRRIAGHTGYRTSGILYLYDSLADEASYAQWLDTVSAFPVDSRFLSAHEISNLLPDGRKQWKGALYTSGDGGAEPSLAAPAIARRARQLGAHILLDCAVRGVERQGGRVSGVVTERGVIRCQSVILAGGAWSRLFCGNLDLDLPQLKVLGSVMRSAPLPGGPEVSLKAPGFGFRKRADGGYIVSQASATVTDIVPDSFRLLRSFWPAFRAQGRKMRLRLGRRFTDEWRLKRRWGMDDISPFELVRMLDPAPIPEILTQACSNLANVFPIFRHLKMAQSWGGFIDVMPDAIPVISTVATVPGLVLATGFSGHGFGLAPAAAQLAVDLATGGIPAADPRPFSFDRFTASGKLQLDQSV